MLAPRPVASSHPDPGARTVEQARENARALEHGPLTPDEVNEIRELVSFGATR